MGVGPPALREAWLRPLSGQACSYESCQQGWSSQRLLPEEAATGNSCRPLCSDVGLTWGPLWPGTPLPTHQLRTPALQVLIPVFALGRAQELCILLETFW